LSKKADIEKKLLKGEAAIVDNKSGKSDIWHLFGRVIHGDEVIKDFVACKSCKKSVLIQTN